MEASRIISGCITALIALVLAVYSFFTARGKGPVFSNRYIWLSKAEKEKVDKKAEYKLVSVISGSICAAFIFITVNIFTELTWALYAEWAALAFAIIYAVVDGIRRGPK